MAHHFFETPQDFRNWLKENHDKASEIIVAFYKKDAGKKSITWPEAVEEALCFGWIDSTRRKIDDESYSNRFTPRKKTSIWSAKNIANMERLQKEGLMHPAGWEAFKHRKEHLSKVYSFESKAKELDEDFTQLFKINRKAWEFFTNQAPSYQKVIIHWIMTAKQEATRLSRLEKTIKASEEEKRLQQ
ncbi:YdeI/OmpD-associated family protein [Flavobacterium soli]|uniref:YdeI/OmpD-associated family protein n=1 Tax=Flavobacterium soli TaxID=344881 RepID=UPI000413B595|nr:YdeI/OmpD-associated family protein [Flavobacterium soli]